MFCEGKRPLALEWRPCKKPRVADDVFYEDGEVLEDVQPAKEEDTVAVQTTRNSFVCKIPECGREFPSASTLQFHCDTCHNNNRCSVCRRTFPTVCLLDIHVLEWHDSMFDILAQKQNMYECLVVNCGTKFATAKDRREHLITVHKYPPKFKFDKPAKKEKSPKKSDKKAQEKSMEEGPCISEQKDTKASHRQDSDTSLDCERITGDPPNDVISEESVEQTSEHTSSRKYIYKVPRNICFGAGSQKGFQRPGQGHKKKKKHWHQAAQSMDTSVNIEHVKMDDLASALET